MSLRGADMAASVRDRWDRGQPILSTFLKLPGLEVLDVLARCGLDAVVLDMEHSQLDEGQGRQLVRHGAAIDLPVLVRLPTVDAGAVGRFLEAGAAGVQLSGVTAREDVARLVGACRYPPRGTRSVSLAQPEALYGAVGIAELTAEEGPLLVAQIEAGLAVEKLPEVVADLDAVFIGLTDLSVDLGVPGQFEAPRVLDAIARISRVVGDAGPRPVLGGWAPSLSVARHLVAAGARYLTIGSDLTLLESAATKAVTHFKEELCLNSTT